MSNSWCSRDEKCTYQNYPCNTTCAKYGHELDVVRDDKGPGIPRHSNQVAKEFIRKDSEDRYYTSAGVYPDPGFVLKQDSSGLTPLEYSKENSIPLPTWLKDAPLLTKRLKIPGPNKEKRPVYPEVVKDLLERVEMGKKEYGEALHTNNGRPALQDAYEEALDLAMYLKQRLMEEEAGKKELSQDEALEIIANGGFGLVGDIQNQILCLKNGIEFLARQIRKDRAVNE